MTKEQIENLIAGRETDILIAKEIFSWKSKRVHGTPAYFSTDIKAAWEIIDVIAKMENHHWRLGSIENAVWFAEIRDRSKREKLIVEAIAETAPLAICRAALLWKFNQAQKYRQAKK